jgi:hypothetical protein
MPYYERAMVRQSIMTAAVLLLSTTIAWGGTVVLNTSTLQGGVDANVGNMQCEALNVGKKPISGTVDFLGVGGGVAQTNNFSIDPGQVTQFAFTSAVGFTVRCRITFTGSKKSILGEMRLQDANFNTISVVPAR